MVHNKNNTILKMIKGEETTHTLFGLCDKLAVRNQNIEIERKIFTIRYYTSAGVVRLCNTFTS